MSDLEEFAKSGLLPAIYTEHGEDNTVSDPAKEVIICDSMSGGANYKNNMPGALRLTRRNDSGEEFTAWYYQIN